MKIPINIVVHQSSKQLELTYDADQTYRIPFELMRVYSPSAEVQGHHPSQAVLQFGKKNIGIEAIEGVGNYAIRPQFSDGHHSGIYTWEYLHTLATEQEKLWTAYLEKLEAAGLSREPSDKEVPTHTGGCGNGGCSAC